jgi:hypothetical protein
MLTGWDGIKDMRLAVPVSPKPMLVPGCRADGAASCRYSRIALNSPDCWSERTRYV